MNQETESRLGSIRQVSSNIDLIFSTTKLADKIDVNQGEDTWRSDHFPIKVIINQEVHVYRKRTNRLSTKKTIWEEYPKVILKKYEERKVEKRNLEETKRGIEAEYQGFIGILKEAVKEISGKGGEKKGKKRDTKEGYVKNREQPKKWWDHECEEAIM